MNNLNLLLTFTLDPSTEVQVRGAARISVDGLGGLVVYNAEGGPVERIPLSRMHALSIGSLSRTVVEHHIN